MVEGRCMKCKVQVEIKDAAMVALKGGRMMLRGKCPKCDTIVCRMLRREKDESNLANV